MQPIIEEKATEENIRKPKKIVEKKQKDESDFEYRVVDNFEEAKSFLFRYIWFKNRLILSLRKILFL